MEAKKIEANGTKMIYLNIGDPAVYGFRPPQKIVEGVKEALGQNFKGYAPSPGDDELRAEAAKLEGCAAEDVFVTTGLSEGIDFLFQAMVDPGDKILLPNPTYPLYITKAAIYEAKPETYNHDKNGEIDLGDLEKRIKGARFIVIINPNNPTGTVYSENNLRKVIELCAARGVPIFYDGSYDRIIFTDYVDFRKLAKGKIPFVYGSSLSKNYLYPGARVGWVAFHGEEWTDVKDAFMRLCNQRLSANWEFQRAAAGAVSDMSHIAKFNRDLLIRRDAMMKTTKSMPLSYATPKGAFYGFMKIESNKWKNDWDFARAALKEGVVFVPGSGFGKQDGAYFRTIFLPSPEVMEQGFKRIEKLL